MAYKVGIISNQLAKEKVLRFFFGKMPVEKFQLSCDEFSDKAIPSLITAKSTARNKKTSGSRSRGCDCFRFRGKLVTQLV